MTSPERKFIWRSDLPRRGWSCTKVVARPEFDGTCEMCGHDIRFEHIVTHPDGHTLTVGCVCAGHMMQDYEGARRREQTAARRIRWLDRKWRTSRNGNPYLNVEGYNVVVYKRGGGWSVRVTNRATDRAGTYKRIFPTVEEAKLAGFDGLQALKKEEGAGGA